ncbi:MAG: flagellar biosynthetic protein FliR [Magnetovibrio sp.]|nr:flagellar biosynthetic protein FliR [Magnetovibrio sp.]
MLSQLINLNLFAFLLVFSRIGAAFTLLPGIGSKQVTMPARLVFALAVSFVMTPALMEFLPAEPVAMSALVLLLASEITIGVFLGVIPRIFMSALQTTGTIMAMLASLSTMFAPDPIAEQQSSALSAYLGLIAITLVFVTNTHHLMIMAIVDSYNLFTPADGPPIGDMADYLARQVSSSFRLGVQLSAPFILAGLVYNLAIGIMGRLMPQLPIFFVGMPIQIGLQIYLLAISVSSIILVFMRYYTDGLQALVGVQGLSLGQGF